MCARRRPNRAEYSLQQHGTIVIALALGGVTLACVGLVRLRGVAFHQGSRPMPREVAVISLVAGVVVTAFGIALLFWNPSERQGTQEPQSPLATLAPVATGSPNDRRSDVTGRVLSIRERGIEGVRVELVVVSEGDTAKKRSTTTDDRGRFAFRNADIHLGSPRMVEAIYDGERFPSVLIRAPRGADPEVDITVAPTTSSTDDLVAEVESVTVVGDETGLQAVHALTIRNEGRRAFVGKLELPLLRGAANIQEGAGIDRRFLVLGHGGMTSTKPILPGTQEISYTYITPMSRDGIALAREPQLPTERFELLTSGDLTAEPTRALSDAGTVKLDGDRSYERFSAEDVAPRTALGARIVIADRLDLVRIGAPIAAGVVAVALLTFGLWRRRRKPATQAEPVAEHAPLG